MLLALLLSIQQACFATEEKGRICGLQYEPTLILSTDYEYINFNTSPLFFPSTAAYGYNTFLTYTDVSVDGNVISTLSEGIIISNMAFSMPTTGALQATGTFSFDAQLVSGTVTSPLGFDSDPFYAAGLFGLLDASWTFAFLVTNTKVYAMYEYHPLGMPFYRYVIPVANRYPEQVSTYSVTVGADYSVSYRIDGVELLRVAPLGTTIDFRFDTGNGYPPNPTILVPTSFRLLFGNYFLDDYTGTAQPACQGTLFNQCSQSLQYALGAQCQYAPANSYGTMPTIYKESIYYQIDVLRYTSQAPCDNPAGCGPKPISCPNVKPVHDRRHHWRPTTATTTMTAPTQPMIIKPPSCGCGRT